MNICMGYLYISYIYVYISDDSNPFSTLRNNINNNFETFHQDPSQSFKPVGNLISRSRLWWQLRFIMYRHQLESTLEIMSFSPKTWKFTFICRSKKMPILQNRLGRQSIASIWTKWGVSQKARCDIPPSFPVTEDGLANVTGSTQNYFVGLNSSLPFAFIWFDFSLNFTLDVF